MMRQKLALVVKLSLSDVFSRMNGFSSTRRSPKIFHCVDSGSLLLTASTLPRQINVLGRHHVIRYTSNDEVRQEFSIVFTARPVRGELRASSESSEPQWVSPAAIAGLQMDPSMRQRIQHYLDQRSAPYLG